MSEPFFSVLLPTKNRAEILGGAIRSVLDQTFRDFELIVSDNDDSPDATRAAVQAFNDPRIVYVRTSGKLPMHENWDNAFSHARGKHVLLLEDKMRFVTNAFEILRRNMNDSLEPVSFSSTSAPGEILAAPVREPRPKRIASDSIIKGFLHFRPRAFHLIPKGFDCCVPKEVLARMKKESPTGYLYSYICPDYSFGFMLLSSVDSIIRLDEPLVYIPNNWMWTGNYSNGQSAYRKDALIRRFVNDLPVKPADIVERVPIKAEFLWINMVLYDFFTKYRRNGRPAEVSWTDYHAFVVTLILLGKRLGASMAEEQAALRDSLRRSGWLFRIRVAAKIGVHLFFAAKQVIVGRISRFANRTPSPK